MKKSLSFFLNIILWSLECLIYCEFRKSIIFLWLDNGVEDKWNSISDSIGTSKRVGTVVCHARSTGRDQCHQRTSFEDFNDRAFGKLNGSRMPHNEQIVTTASQNQ